MINGITGAHWLMYSTDPEADRAFFKDVIGFRAVDAGEGWLIFALPPSEMAVHPGDGKSVQQHAEHGLTGAVLYLMCEDIRRQWNRWRLARFHTRRSAKRGGGNSQLCNCRAGPESGSISLRTRGPSEGELFFSKSSGEAE